MSVDIVGSTAFKQSATVETLTNAGISPLPVAPWFSPIMQFYRQIELLFAKEWQICSEVHAPNAKWSTGEPPIFWKGVGDEVIYFKNIAHHEEAYCCVICWMNVVKSYRAILRSKFPKLDLKATCWIAGFPINNCEIIFRSQVKAAEEPESGSDPAQDNYKLLELFYSGRQNDLVRDFIGPSIDTGFRISALSTPRKMVVSVDLALMLSTAQASRPHDFAYPEMRFYFDGSISLKGVIDGVPYPIVWVDLSGDDRLERAEDKISRRENVSADELKSFCEEFIIRHSEKVSRPYILGGHDKLFHDPPDRHSSEIEKLKNYFENERLKEIDLEASHNEANQAGQQIDETDASQFAENIVKASLKGSGSKLKLSRKPRRTSKPA